jgi:hypothetical protein
MVVIGGSFYELVVTIKKKNKKNIGRAHCLARLLSSKTSRIPHRGRGCGGHQSKKVEVVVAIHEARVVVQAWIWPPPPWIQAMWRLHCRLMGHDMCTAEGGGTTLHHH